MKIDGNELISKATASSSRNLAIAASGIIYISWYNLNPAEWGLLNGQVGVDAFRGGAAAIVLYLTVSLLVHWFGDYVSYRKWFKSNEFAMGSIYGNSSPKSGEMPLNGLIRRVSNFEKTGERLKLAYEELETAIGREEVARSADEPFYKRLDNLSSAVEKMNGPLMDIKNNLEAIILIVDELDVRFSRTDIVSRFQVYFWHFGMPLSLAAVSLYILFFGALSSLELI